MLFFFTLFYAITTEKVKYSLIYESGSWCDYWTDLGLVNIQVRQNQLATEKMSNFSMMLQDEDGNEYRANCTVLPQYEEDENPNVKPTEIKNSNSPSHHDEDTDNMNEDEDEDEFYEDQTEDEKISDKEKETDEANSKIPKKNSDIKGTEKAIDETDKEDLDEIKDTRENLDEDEDEKEGEGKKGNSDKYSFEDKDKEGENKEGENEGDDEDKERENKEGENKEGENEGDDEDKEGENKEGENEGEEQENTEHLRNLEEYIQAKHAFCYFDPPKVHVNLKYVENTLKLPEGAKFEVEVKDNFFIMAQACFSAKDAEKQYNVNLSFRQLNHFKNENGKISFNFYGLTTQDLGVEVTIIIQIHLIGMNREPLKKEVVCKIQSAVTLGNNVQAQAEFLCEIENVGTEYTELELSYSESIAGIPYDDETLLNPKKTDDAINDPNSELYGLDYSKNENIPLMFNINGIDTSKASDEGIFILYAKFDKATEAEYEFTIPLTHPKGNAICTIPIAQAGSTANIICILDGEVHNQNIIFEQRILMFKGKQLFTMSKFESTEPFTSKNGVEFKMERKRNLKLSFKQINTFKFETNKITFNFFGLTTSPINAGDNLIKLFVFLIAGAQKYSHKVPASCSLKSNVEMKNAKQALAQFECEITELVAGTTYSSFELVSSDDLAGIPDDETLLDIAKTDAAINSGSLTTPSENLPPLFIPSTIDGEKCHLGGEFIITGELNGNADISEFDLPLSYPTDHTAKCKVESSQVKCTMMEDFVNQNITIEQQSIRKGFTELMTIEGFTSEKEFSCIQGNFTEDNNSNEPSIDGKQSDQQGGDAEKSDQPGEGDITNKQEEGEGTNKQEGEEGTNKQEGEEGTNKQEGEEGTNKPSGDDNKTETPESSEEEEEQSAEERANLTLSFRQLNDFKWNDGTITFKFFGLTTENLEAGFEIILIVNLINMDGERDENNTDVTCKLERTVTVEEGKSTQVDFKCELTGLDKEIEYYSLRLNSSKFIAGIPEDDETLLDPKLTEKAITDKELLDYADEKNKNKIPITFTFTKIDQSSCSEDGSFIIEGTSSEDIQGLSTFSLPLTLPEGASLNCLLLDGKKDSSKIKCQVDREINGQIIVEQTIIKDGPEEILNIGSIAPEENLTCLNGHLKEVEERIKKPVSFRQISHLKPNGINGFSFFLATLLTQRMTKGDSINVKMIVIIKGEKAEKETKCILRDNVEVEEGSQAQGDFDCEGTLEEDEYKGIDFEDSGNVTISTNNKEVLGVSDLDQEQASPLATEIAINKTKEIIEKEGVISPLEEEIDFSLEENKAIIPPSFELVRITENTFGYWAKKGKIKIIGKFNKDITEKMTFDLPLSFPSANIKCEVEKATKDVETELTCKVQKGFKKVKNFVVEQRTIKKRHREMVIIKYKKCDFNQEIECENYNKIQLEKAQKRKNSNTFFLQLGNKIEHPQPNAFQFFMAFLFRDVQSIQTTISISIRIITGPGRLRNLQEENDKEISCKQSLVKGNAGGYNCGGDNINLNDLELNTDDMDDISGVPANAQPSKQNNTIDYSNSDNLEALEKLPNIEIEKINGEECKNNGSYTIEGTVKGELKDMSNVEIPMSSTDSSALCKIKVNGEKVTMDCQSKEKFSISPIIFESTIIKKDGKDIFLLSNYSTTDQFSCIISTASEEARAPTSNTPTSTPASTPVSTTTPGEDEPKSVGHNRYYSNNSSKGLTGGAIAGIIIACLAAVAIVAALIVLIKKGVFASKKAIPELHQSSNSSVDMNLKIDANNI